MNIEQLKRLLQNVIERYADKTEFFGEVRRDFMAIDCLSAIKELEAENERLKAMKWISVDDVKPQWGKEVKVKFKDGSEDEVRFSHDYKWISRGKMLTRESSEVTHWMPLPPAKDSSATEKENGKKD